MKNLIFILVFIFAFNAVAETVKGTFRLNGQGSELELSVLLENSPVLQGSSVPARFNLRGNGDVIDYEVFVTQSYSFAAADLDTSSLILTVSNSEFTDVLFNLLRNNHENEVNNTTSLVEGNRFPKTEVIGRDAKCVVEFRPEPNKKVSQSRTCQIQL